MTTEVCPGTGKSVEPLDLGDVTAAYGECPDCHDRFQMFSRKEPHSPMYYWRLPTHIRTKVKWRKV